MGEILTKSQSEKVMKMHPHFTKKEICRALLIKRSKLDAFYDKHGLKTPRQVLISSQSQKGKTWCTRRIITRDLMPYETKEEYDLRYSTEIIKNSNGGLKFICFADLNRLVEMYDMDLSLSDMAYHMNTTSYHVLEALEVLKLIKRVKDGLPMFEKPEAVVIDNDEKKLDEQAINPTFKRPPAVYSNSSPYGIAQPGLSVSRHCIT